MYDVVTGYFSYYGAEEEAGLGMPPQGSVRVVTAVLRPTPEHPQMFSFFTEVSEY